MAFGDRVRKRRFGDRVKKRTDPDGYLFREACFPAPDVPDTSVVVHYSQLEIPKVRRKDKRAENYWKEREKKWPLNSWEEHQKKWNFIEFEYNVTAANHGHEFGDVAWVVPTKLAKYLVHKKARIRNGQIVKVWRQGEEEPKDERNRG